MGANIVGPCGLAVLCAGLLLTPFPATAANHPPLALAVIPASGAGSPQLFVTRFSDPDGWQDLRSVQLLVNTSADPAGGLRLLYRPGSGRLYLHDGSGWRGGYLPGQHEAVTAAAGILFARESRALGSSDRLTVKWYLGFRSPLRGRDLRLYLQARDRSGATTGWVEAGTWRAPDGDLPLPLFPADNPWNTDISGYPVHPRSDRYIASIGADTGLHPDFGAAWDGAPIGFPYALVPGDQPAVPISFYYPDESDPGPYPIPLLPPIEGGPFSSGDRHILVVDTDHRFLYEVYDAHRRRGAWQAGSGAVFDLAANDLRPDGWTSADAAGLPILPGLVRRGEALSGAISHALRFTVSRTRRAYIHPATHFASDDTNPDLPPMGLRLRLKAGYDISGFPIPVRVILQALKTYGMLVADNGADWFISGVPDADWDDEELSSLGQVKGSDFEAVFTGPVHTR